MSPLIIYIHGFLSSPKSQKAQEVQQFLAEEQLAIDFIAPGFSNYPGEAYQQMVDLVNQERANGRATRVQDDQSTPIRVKPMSLDGDR